MGRLLPDDAWVPVAASPGPGLPVPPVAALERAAADRVALVAFRRLCAMVAVGSAAGAVALLGFGPLVTQGPTVGSQLFGFLLLLFFTNLGLPLALTEIVVKTHREQAVLHGAGRATETWTLLVAVAFAVVLLLLVLAGFGGQPGAFLLAAFLAPAAPCVGLVMFAAPMCVGARRWPMWPLSIAALGAIVPLAVLLVLMMSPLTLATLILTGGLFAGLSVPLVVSFFVQAVVMGIGRALPAQVSADLGP